ncbi:MAG TPA: hypothetical protein VF746_08620 [Longimicrobium sp.]|jgi:hypothetical protein
MRKLKLDVEELKVDSFEVAEDEKAPRGTVRGHAQYTDYRVCDTAVDCSWNSCPSNCVSACAVTCYDTCEATCEMSCHYGSSCGL